jgi:hypothetical protein
MKVFQYYQAAQDLNQKSFEKPNFKPHLAMIFGDRSCLEKSHLAQSIKSEFPNCIVVGCSTAGQVEGTEVRREGMAVTYLYFEKS